MNNEWHKQPGEVESIEVVFSARMTTGETIATQTVTAIETTHNTSATTAVIDSSAIVDTSVYIKVKDGTDGVDYKITVIVTTSGGNILEEDILMKVYDV